MIMKEGIAMKFLFFSVALIWLTNDSISNPIEDETNAMLYLQKFGYVEESINYRSGSAAIMDEESFSDALRDFQRFGGINQTGELDNDTISLMSIPRCGVKDIVGHSATARRKRYALQGSKWRVQRLTYRISKYPTKIKDKQKVDKEIARAFKVWGDVTSLSFEERKRGRVNIEVSFEKGEHGDGDPFDGPGKTLAHAFFPQYGGDAHFDNEEKWTIEERVGTNLFQVAAHEFGHSLGLSHSDEKRALMAPYYRGYEASFKLNKDDVTAIQSLYGKGGSTPEEEDAGEDEPSGPPPDTSDAPDLCQDASIDAVTRIQNGSTFVFKGEFYWKVLNEGIADGYPRKIVDDWDGLEKNLDAAITWSNGKTFFFKGGRYWRFTNRKMDRGYPKLVSVGFEGIPDMLDAAFVWSGNGKTYFFKGDQYWRYDSNSDPPVSSKYPRPISNWNGLPNDIDAAFQWENSKTYFFKGDKYYRFNDGSFEVDNGTPTYPRSTSIYWFDCVSISHRTDPPTSNTTENATETPGPETNYVPRRRPLSLSYSSLSNIPEIEVSEEDESSKPHPDTGDAADPSEDASIDDVTRIQNGNTYVSKGDSIPSEMPGGPKSSSLARDKREAPDICQDASVDAVTQIEKGSTYIFKGEYYWKVLNEATADGYPRKIVDDWDGLEANLDAALTWPNGKTFFFKGERYWRFTKHQMDRGYPKFVNASRNFRQGGFLGIPDNVSAACVWSGNGRTYFFKGDQYWKYDTNSTPPVSGDFPAPINNWNGLPNDIDAAVLWENNKSYFFKGNGYYRFDDDINKVNTESYPMSTARYWFGCKEN